MGYAEDPWEQQKGDMREIVALLAQAIVDIVDEEKTGWASESINKAKELMDKYEGGKCSNRK